MGGPVNRILSGSQNGLEQSVITSRKSPLRQSLFINKSKDRAIAMSRNSKLLRNSSHDFDCRWVWSAMAWIAVSVFFAR
jgi:hypothetical protein